MKTSLSSSRGFTLVEVMVAIVIILIGMLGLVKAVGVAAFQNLNNQLRDEAVLIGEAQMADAQRRPYGMMSSSFGPRELASRIRIKGKGFTVTRGRADQSSVSLPDGTVRTSVLTVNVSWTYKNSTFNHNLNALRVYKDDK